MYLEDGSKPVLADTSIWIEHLRQKTEVIRDLYNDPKATIVLHPMVVAELVLGGVTKKHPEYHQFQLQLMLDKVTDAELLDFIERNQIAGSGIGYVDATLLASCIKENALIVTKDKSLAILAERLNIAYNIGKLITDNEY